MSLGAHDPTTGNPQRNVAPAILRKEVETCGLCHARRASSPKIGCPVSGCRTPTSSRELSRGLYHADGQMQDEVYNYGSFKQSKMFAAGVTCSDCHDPHDAQTKSVRRRRLPAMPCSRTNTPLPRTTIMKR